MFSPICWYPVPNRMCCAQINMYKKFGYSVYRQVVGYYSGPNSEDAYDMRKALPRDTQKRSIIPLDPLEVLPSEVD
eukprot:COSAG02_NODE_18222_length_952_cov_2.724502_1_plen_76_part_00